MDASFSAWRSLTTLGEVLPMCHMGKHKGTIRPHLGEVHAKNDHIAVGVAGCDETYCWWLSSCTSWYVVYHSLSHCLQGFIHPRWCRISSINSMSRFFLHPGPAAGWTRTLFSGSWFRSPFFSRFFTPFFSCDFSVFSFGSTYFLKPLDFDGFHFRFEVPPWVFYKPGNFRTCPCWFGATSWNLTTSVVAQDEPGRKPTRSSMGYVAYLLYLGYLGPRFCTGKCR